MEKPKKDVPIDPLLAQQYFADAASKARGIIEWPAHEVAERPAHDVVPVVDPDRDAARKASEAHQDYQFMKQFYDNDVDAMRGVKDARDQAEYAKAIGKDPNSYVGIRTPGNIKSLVGDENSVFTNKEVASLNADAEEALRETEIEGDKFIAKLPKGAPRKKFDRNEFRRELNGIEPLKPYDQDEPTSNAA